MAIKIYVDHKSANDRIAFVKNTDLAQYNLIRLNHGELGRPSLFTAGRYIVAVLDASHGWADLVLLGVKPGYSLEAEIKDAGCSHYVTSVVPKSCDSKAVGAILSKMEQYILRNYNELEDEVQLEEGWPRKLECHRHCGVGPVMFFATPA